MASQVDGRGHFAKVRLRVEIAGKTSINFTDCETPYKNPDPHPHYEAAVSFGIRLALERIQRADQWKTPPYRITVLEILTLATDSTEAVVSFAAANAFLNALKRTDETIILDRENRSFRIPLF